MRHFIFITTEGYTYQPNSDSIEPDVENSQVLGFGSGDEIEEAFENFLADNAWLKETAFNKTMAYELKGEEIAGYFYLGDS